MIEIKKAADDGSFMDVTIKGNAEDVAMEYAALTLKLKKEFYHIYDRAIWYLKHVEEDPE